jgi:hypothetical protein
VGLDFRPQGLFNLEVFWAGFLDDVCVGYGFLEGRGEADFGDVKGSGLVFEEFWKVFLDVFVEIRASVVYGEVA